MLKTKATHSRSLLLKATRWS